ncbi:UPF0481 protein At3g47200-like [Pistacia vera]|uniref:UPF0481 protein At3g47200-like n=1 Tax=Pistacia vera TaxID=55513 RepID=UPI00126365D4|nr:UPF0481 protein At3g47200-like [Pistacia vera]
MALKQCHYPWDIDGKASHISKTRESELDPSKCCIYRVPEPIRRVNKGAYTPQLISIGPLHHENKKLANMEKEKRRYMNSFLERITPKKQGEIFNFIKDNENDIRKCYAETSKLKGPKYIMMILYDAIFIIELFLRNKRHEGTGDSLLSIATVRYNLGSDLQLLENQLPYFVLDKIFKLASVYTCMPTLMELSFEFYRYNASLALNIPTSQLQVKHFTDWKRNTLLENYPISGQVNKRLTNLPSATKLHESGVKFKKIDQRGDKLIRFKKQLYELQLPYFKIVDGTECVIRNVMALEQCCYPKDTRFCNYIKLMDFLIDTEKDVDLLAERGIISCYARDYSSTANMFNKLCRCIGLSETSYYETCEELKKHCNSNWNKAIATLRRVYFSNPWRGTGTVAAVILLLLTIIQTICSIFQVV